jgi:hypothetical protein
VKGEPVIDRPEAAALHDQVAGLAVGVVDNQVQDGDRPEDRIGSADQIDGVEPGVPVDEALHRPGAEGPFPDHGLGDAVEAEGGGRLGREHLPVGEGGDVEVPQGAVARRRLVHDQFPGAAAQQRGVRGGGEAADDRVDERPRNHPRRLSPFDAGHT